ncbi:short chain dehydrogenase/reductase family oxidoreductase [Hyphomonas polymorpha PS728]|uniref:Short chain dehydrogenase/reductase family oxidoreductase n=1 Tax=Hyphomonas polymorpha PS728 TaxID=1280954 RepID=A0A062VKE5_9PROT|nr:SDR family oxidoreductase [Hyphomonas polymorpha]KCZ98580.1 short chain dehydrogenase/reductase family oxidoreductase [Hyphomonas polymorpha PS728]
MTDLTAPALPRSLLVTGASTGIGEACARHMAARGWTVFAGVRSLKDADALKDGAMGDLRPLILDVTKPEQVEAAVTTIGTALGNKRLSGLLNNAGIAKMGPLAIQPLDDFEAHFSVNVFGLLRVTQAMVPLLGGDPARQGPPGRIVTITSVGGKIAAPFLGAYTATKHANEAMTDTLRRELAIYGIDAIAVGPGSVRTPIWNKAEKDNEDGLYSGSDWEKPLEIFEETMLKGGKTGLPPQKIAEVVEDALSSRKPKARYAPVPDKLTNFTIASRLPKRWLDAIFIKRFELKKK